MSRDVGTVRQLLRSLEGDGNGLADSSLVFTGSEHKTGAVIKGYS